MERASNAASVPQIAVVGAGPAGLAAALALARLGCAVTVLDARPLPEAGKPPPEEGRTVALLEPAVALLMRLQVWDRLVGAAEPLRALRIVSLREDGGAPEADVCFEAREIGLAQFGYNLPVATLRAALLDALRAEGGELLGEAAVEDVVRERGRVLLVHARGTIAADLVIAADGRHSAVRRALGIAALERPTGRMAIALSFAHAQPHGGVSVELHRPGGAFTLVPLPGQRSSLVWVEREAEAERLLALPEDAFRDELARRIAPWLGAVGAIGRRDGYRLVGLLADRLVAPRAALVGEAAHALSPVGAQGLNTSLRDVAVLTELVKAARARGEDPGSPRLLLAYERARLADIRARFALTQGLAALAASGFAPIAAGRALGLRLLAAVPAARTALMRALLAPLPWPPGVPAML